MTSSAHALVFGASGLAGWGVVDQLLESYPDHGTFSRVTALVNRPLDFVDSGWPSPSSSGPELDLVSGIDLTHGTVEEFTALLKERVEGIATVTHVFYFAYTQDWDGEKETKINREMLERVLGALDRLSPNLAFVAFPSGTMAYGIYTPGGVLKAPFKESMVLPGPHARGSYYLRYYALEELLAEKSDGKSWTWCEVRPDAIVGFTPNGSPFNLAAHWASYPSLYALVEGKGAAVPYPGTKDGYECLFNDASADIIAKFSIWASLHPEKAGNGQLFNIANEDKPSKMSDRWPGLTQYFGLKGVGPTKDPSALKPGEYIKKHQHVFEEHGIKASKVVQSEHLDGYGYHFTFDRQLSLKKAKRAGFSEEIDSNFSWFKAFGRFKRFGMIPA